MTVIVTREPWTPWNYPYHRSSLEAKNRLELQEELLSRDKWDRIEEGATQLGACVTSWDAWCESHTFTYDTILGERLDMYANVITELQRRAGFQVLA